MQRWGFEFGKGTRSAQLKESERIVMMRRQYLRLKRSNRDTTGLIERPEIYLDESYINKNHSNDNTWFFEEDDYHANMNWNNFSKWFQEQLIKNIPENSLIIMDNAAYHNVLAEEAFPKKGHSVKRLREWLSINQYPWTRDMLKSELFELCSRLAQSQNF